MTDKKKIEQYKAAQEIAATDQESDKIVDEPETESTQEIEADTPAEKTVEDPLRDLERKLETAEEEVKETRDKYLRVCAEFENYKKRSAREAKDFRKYANESLLKEMLAVVDYLELAIKASNEHTNNHEGIVEGIDITLKQVIGLLRKYDVTPVDAVGTEFDPRYHEAFLQEESTEHPENTVIRELQKGYMLHDRLLRPTVVAVSKAKEIPDAEEDERQEDK